jgi:hypothetical protein
MYELTISNEAVALSGVYEDAAPPIVAAKRW